MTKIAAKCTQQNITPGDRSTTPAKYSKKYGPNLKSMRKASIVNFGQPEKTDGLLIYGKTPSDLGQG